MKLAGKKIGLAITGSHCHLEHVFPVITALLAEKAEIFPIVSESVQTQRTRFGEPEQWLERISQVTGRKPWRTLAEVEPIGPRRLLDVLLVCPCTGNSLAKFANAITDTPVCMSFKAQLRNGRPVVLAITSNDLLGLNAKNLGLLLNTRHVYFVPFGQDDPFNKPNSLTADWNRVVPTLEAALEGRQLQPLLLQYVRENGC